ncbi:hypothetical protein [Streptomyces sp. NPDC059398]|uniref:hypothetical protein n=1 Tax=Streptomyces sp. NPDC059398 TaxID=3346820 RepID=UPI0036A4DA1D
MGMKDQFRDKAQQLAEKGKQSMGGAEGERSSRPDEQSGERGGRAGDRAEKRVLGEADRVRDQFDS